MEIGTILTSTVVATLVSGIVTGLYSLHAKQREYVNEYFKTILHRRIAAYAQLEELIVSIKTAVLDDDGKPYHLLFSKDDDWQTAYGLLANITSQALWLSAEAFDKTQKLNYLMFPLKPGNGAIEFGKTNYTKIAELRTELEVILANDLLHLYDVKSFLELKRKIKSEFRVVNLHR
jgi:hypothetical protein